MLKVSITANSKETQVVDYGYDVSGRRTARRVWVLDIPTNELVVTESAITHYDGQNRLAEFDSTGKIVRYYLSGTGPNEVLAVDQGGSTAWALHDQLGSVGAWGTHDGTTNSTAWLLQHQAFDAFGNLEGQTTNLAIGDLPTIWAGHQLDAATDLYHMQARWYDPRTGQFLSPDPIRFAAGDSNLYRYVSNDPMNAVDPNGLAEDNLQWITDGTMQELVDDGLARESGNYRVITTPLGDHIRTFVYSLAVNPGAAAHTQWQLNASFNRGPIDIGVPLVDLLIRQDTQAWADRYVEASKDNAWSSAIYKSSNLVVMGFSMVPFVAGADHLSQEEYVDATISFAGDVLLLGANKIGKALQAAKTSETLIKARKWQVRFAAAEGVIAVTRVGQAGYAAYHGENGKAAGYIGEAILRIFGVRYALKKPSKDSLGKLVKVNVVDDAADALADRLGGISRVKFANGPDNEFDAVSDLFVAQSKPKNFVINKKFRKQAQATFETAIKTGRTPYFHFENAPHRDVLRKLSEYAERYNIKPVINTIPLER